MALHTARHAAQVAEIKGAAASLRLIGRSSMACRRCRAAPGREACRRRRRSRAARGRAARPRRRRQCPGPGAGPGQHHERADPRAARRGRRWRRGAHRRSDRCAATARRRARGRHEPQRRQVRGRQGPLHLDRVHRRSASSGCSSWLAAMAASISVSAQAIRMAGPRDQRTAAPRPRGAAASAASRPGHARSAASRPATKIAGHCAAVRSPAAAPSDGRGRGRRDVDRRGPRARTRGPPSTGAPSAPLRDRARCAARRPRRDARAAAAPRSRLQGVHGTRIVGLTPGHVRREAVVVQCRGRASRRRQGMRPRRRRVAATIAAAARVTIGACRSGATSRTMHAAPTGGGLCGRARRCDRALGGRSRCTAKVRHRQQTFHRPGPGAPQARLCDPRQRRHRACAISPPRAGQADGTQEPPRSAHPAQRRHGRALEGVWPAGRPPRQPSPRRPPLAAGDPGVGVELTAGACPQ